MEIEKIGALAAYPTLEKNKELIINKWLEHLGAPQDQILKEESNQLLSSLIDITRNNNLPDLDPQKMEPVIRILTKLHTSKSKLGYTAKETAFYLYTLKKSFMEFLKENHTTPNADMTEEIGNFNNLLDIMGIFALEEFSQMQKTEMQRKDEEISYLRYQVYHDKSFVDIIGNSPQMQQVFKAVGTIIDTDVTILIEGESGTGKELIAEVIHYNSIRKDKPFIAVNCGALPAELIESELFGHEKGAFTGAINDKLGKFELATDGTLFLDEIGEMPLAAQVKLLRALQKMEIQHVGGTKNIKVNTRIIAATNKKLEDLIKAGKFRDDLYYRLNVFPIIIAPVRDRKEDIIPLANHFANIFARKYNKSITGITEAVQSLLLSYDWPGNAREIENVIHRAVIITTDQIIRPEDISLPKKSLVAAEFTQYLSGDIKTLAQAEKETIEKALFQTAGNIKKTAEKLGISRTTLYTKIKEYKIEISQ